MVPLRVVARRGCANGDDPGFGSPQMMVPLRRNCTAGRASCCGRSLVATVPRRWAPPNTLDEKGDVPWRTSARTGVPGAGGTMRTGCVTDTMIAPGVVPPELPPPLGGAGGACTSGDATPRGGSCGSWSYQLPLSPSEERSAGVRWVDNARSASGAVFDDTSRV
eukprot:gene41875-15180_t